MPVPPGALGVGSSGPSKPVRALPWTERHKPRHLGEVIGNTDQVRKLAEWLRDWDEVVLKGKVKEAPAPEAWQKFTPTPDNINARAALISGPPGIGKTTTCTLVARCNPKYRLMEFNASDARGRAVIEQMSTSLAGNHTLRLGEGGKSIERAVIIMDECDGMSGGDKGGVQALMNMIKGTKNPIICICNERNDQQVRNLASVCYDIKFRRPENTAVARRVKHVMEGEGKKVDMSTIEAVVEACGHDIRHIINQAQFFGTVASHGKESQKDTQVMLSPFEATGTMLSATGSKLPSMDKRLDMFYLDPEMIPLMIQENYLRTFEKRRRRDNNDLATCAAAAELIALSDTMSGNWEVGGSSAVIGSIYPAYLAADESFSRPSFPAWLQKRAPAAKAERLVHEMHGKVRAVTSCSIREISTSNYHDVLYKKLLKPLQFGAAKDCAAMMFGCGLTREFFTDQAPALRQPLLMEDGYKKVEGRFKHQLLQELQALVQQAQPVKRKREDVDGMAKRGKGEGDDAQDGGAAGPASAKKKPAVKKNNQKGSAKEGAGSLKGWRPKRVVPEGEEDTQAGEKKPLMIMKYLDGHTCAVRRTVHMKDIMEPWVLF